MKTNSRFFGVNFLKSFLLYVIIFTTARFIFRDNINFLSAPNLLFIFSTALILAALNAVRKNQDFKTIDEDTVDELKARKVRFYLGFFGYLFLVVLVFSLLLLALGTATYYLIFSEPAWEWQLLWKTLLFTLVLSVLLSIYSFLSDQWKISSYEKSRSS